MKKSVMMVALLAGLTLTGVAGAQTADAPTTPPAARTDAPPPDGPPARPDFAALDADGDGAVTREEMQVQAAARFANADTDGNGGLSAQELIAQRDQMRAERLNRMIADRDTNGDGLLQPDEMAPKGDRMDRMFDRIDANDDGSIDAAEYDAAPRRGDRGDGMRHDREGDDHVRKPRG